uniref:Nudix hydrolase domain-containing protein n=1 Tax=Alexandrium catenella TaxID=2925 RepID=A0A7S1LGU7_ALECA|mmetsp:Transcript_113231/g.300828  ORF Transcript_113231/g.300828 Transcript_113231/m.300828 type:complete len:341 (+) Transcript_113231:57-1079(+)
MHALRRLPRAGTGTVGQGWRGRSAVAAAEHSPAPSRPPAVSAALQRHERERPPSISVHKGLKIQAALCVERPPTKVIEPDFKRRWRAFKEAWELRTANSLTIQDEIVFMRFFFHFLGDKTAQRELAGGSTAQVEAGKKEEEEEAATKAAGELAKVLTPKGETAGGLDRLLADEGLDLAFPQPRRKTARRRRVQTGPAEQQEEEGMRSLRRLSDRSLFLVVQYAAGGSWTFPKAERVHGQAMREALLRLCARQLGQRFEPYIVGACPFVHRKLRSDRHPGIEGRKIFYYRARLVPGMTPAPPGDSPVADWAWCSRDELPRYLGNGEWLTLRDSLPLDEVVL